MKFRQHSSETPNLSIHIRQSSSEIRQKTKSKYVIESVSKTMNCKFFSKRMTNFCKRAKFWPVQKNPQLVDSENCSKMCWLSLSEASIRRERTAESSSRDEQNSSQHSHPALWIWRKRSGGDSNSATACASTAAISAPSSSRARIASSRRQGWKIRYASDRVFRIFERLEVG